MFYELAISHWLSAGQCPNGLIVRLQGFGEGVFGGNFHTHNSLQMPPGIDVVCYSNGRDYARGMRYCLEQAAAGRVVMSVDSTSLLNLRHVDSSAMDNAWMTRYPAADDEVLPWSDVVRYDDDDDDTGRVAGGLAIVTYGHGVVHALGARTALKASGFEYARRVTVIDVPLLSEVADGLREVVSDFDAVIFADVCKQGQQPLAGIATQLHTDKRLPRLWSSVASTRTYNPLGTTLTFLSQADIIKCCQKMFDGEDMMGNDD